MIARLMMTGEIIPLHIFVTLFCGNEFRFHKIIINRGGGGGGGGGFYTQLQNRTLHFSECRLCKYHGDME